MFINKTSDGLNNICGNSIKSKRKRMGISQRELADKLQIAGLDLDKNAIQRIECGKRFVTDIEIKYFASVLKMKYDELLKQEIWFKWSIHYQLEKYGKYL